MVEFIKILEIDILKVKKKERNKIKKKQKMYILLVDWCNFSYYRLVGK